RQDFTTTDHDCGRMQPEHQDQHQRFLGITLRQLSQSTLSGGHSFSEISLLLYPVAAAYSQLLPH
ncbi:hypothetical protein KI387_010916, partial [Taxus chinensis]